MYSTIVKPGEANDLIVVQNQGNDLLVVQNQDNDFLVVPGEKPDDLSVVSTSQTVSVHFSKFSTIPEFFETEDLGVHPPKMCNTCKKCPDCKFRNSSLSRDEAEVVAKQESLMTHNKTEKKIEVQYAWNENLHIAFQKSVEKKLIKQNELEAYNAEIKKKIDKGYLVKLEKDDLQDYKGPISYVSHHPVYKDSKTTPVRPVTNTSLKNNRYGI